MAILNLDVDMTSRMEGDLAKKAGDAFASAGVDTLVYGVFDLDDLERKKENELGKGIAVGIAYAGIEPPNLGSNPNESAAPGRSNAVKMLSHRFLVLLAVPVTEDCEVRYNATKLLTVLRRGIHGSKIDGDEGSRTWNFLTEAPRPDASSSTMLYYTQVWQVSLPLVGTVQ